MDGVVAGAAVAHRAEEPVNVHRAGVRLGAETVGEDTLEPVLLHQSLADEFEIGAHVGFGDRRRLVVRHFPRRAVGPGVGRARGVDPGDNKLLTVAEDFYLVLGAIGSLEGGGHFRKGIDSLKRNRPLRRRSEAAHHHPAVAEQFLKNFAGQVGGVGVHDVDVDRRRVGGEHAGIGAGPRLYFGETGIDLALPAGDGRSITYAGYGCETVFLQCEANVGGGHGQCTVGSSSAVETWLRGEEVQELVGSPAGVPAVAAVADDDTKTLVVASDQPQPLGTSPHIEHGSRFVVL